MGNAHRLRLGRANITIDSKEGVIYVKCQPRVPYQVHLLERIREYVEARFRRFRENVNGRLGFQYREIVWDVADMFDQGLDATPPTLFSFNMNDSLPFVRWTVFMRSHASTIKKQGASSTSLLHAEIISTEPAATPVPVTLSMASFISCTGFSQTST